LSSPSPKICQTGLSLSVLGMLIEGFPLCIGIQIC
jgi:hypothetical protein